MTINALTPVDLTALDANTHYLIVLPFDLPETAIQEAIDRLTTLFTASGLIPPLVVSDDIITVSLIKELQIIATYLKDHGTPLQHERARQLVASLTHAQEPTE